MSAHDILQAAAGHMQDRAATYDKPEGERSIGAAVKAFNAVTGDGLMDSEERGWMFMAILKMVRSQQGNYRADNYEDLAAYSALMGESACEERNGGWTPEAIAGASFKRPYHHDVLPGHELYGEDDEKRMDVVGQNGNDGAHYWHINLGVRPAIPGGTRVMVGYRDGDYDTGEVHHYDWSLGDNDYDIIRWRLA
jgi:hypothetical protein